MPRLPPLLLSVALATAVAACQPAPDPQAAQAAREAAAEQAAEAMAAQFEARYLQQDWALAKAHGDVLLAEYPGSEAAARIAERHAEAAAKLGAEREAQRTAALWAYQAEPVGKREQLSAAIYARENVESDGGTPRPVRLIFRDHPEWGDSSYLVMETGDFDCYGGCRVSVAVDGAEPRRMAASRPKTDEAIAMFIEDEKALWRLAEQAAVLSIEFPVKAGGTRTAVFETGGVDSSRMPSWWK